MTDPVLRRLTAADDRTLFRIISLALADLLKREGPPWQWDEDHLGRWELWRGLFEHVRDTSDEAWGAEQDGELVGYARSIRRGDSRELTEFFVLPEVQGKGIGRLLLERAFPADVGHRSILATWDARALSRYLRLGLHSSTTIYGFEGPPVATPVPTPEGLTARPMTGVPEAARDAAIGAIDEAILGFSHEVDHRWLLGDRDGWLLERAGAVVGYAYAGRWSATRSTAEIWDGPIATLEPGDMPWGVTLVERAVAEAGRAQLSLNVPLANTAAADHMLARGYHLDGFTMHLLEDTPRVAADRYVVTTPPFFL